MRVKYLILLVMLSAVTLLAQDIWNPANGVYIKQKGNIYPSDSVSGDLYYTRYEGTERVKKVTFRYNGMGYFRLENKMTLAHTPGADGIVHHPDGDLLIAGQNEFVYKVSKSTGNISRQATDAQGKAGIDGIYHLMMDPDNETLWAAGIPGQLFSFPLDASQTGKLGTGTFHQLKGQDTKIATLAWDENGQVFYTASNDRGYGSFGIIDMHTKTTTRLLGGVVEAAHGMTYDPYSKTIIMFGNKKITQVDPISKLVVAEIDFGVEFGSVPEFEFKYNNKDHGFRFDQGTVDGKGHLYVAENNGYLVFVDYTSNPLKRIDNNILIHVQFLDKQLDDVAPLSGAGSEPKTTVVLSSASGYSSGWYGSSGGNQYWSSSSRSSSSAGGGSSGSIGGSSGSTGGSSGSIGGSSGSTGGSSGSIGGSSGSTGGSSGSTGGSSGSTGGSSGSIGGSSGSTGGSSGSVNDPSSGSGSGGSSGSVNNPSSGSGSGGSGGSVNDPSSGSGSGGSGGSVNDPSSGSGSGGSGGSVNDPSSGSGSGGSGGSVDDPSSGSGSGGSGGSVDDPSSGSGSGGSGGSVDDPSSGSGSGGSGGSVDDPSSGSGSGGSGGSVDDPSSGSGSGGSGGSVGDPSSGSGSGGSGGSVGDPSSGSGSGGSGGSVNDPSSGSTGSGTGGFIPDWADEDWDFGGIGNEIPDNSGVDDYPSQDKREVADSSITGAQQIIPVAPGQPFDPLDTVVIDGKTYLKTNPPGDPISGFEPGGIGSRDSVPTGAIISIDLDIERIKDFFDGAGSIVVSGSEGITIMNPQQGGGFTPTVAIPLDGSVPNVWITSETPALGGYIKFTSPSGKTLIYNGVDFYDPLPEPELAILKDSDADDQKDAIEIFLDRPLHPDIKMDSLQVSFGGKTVTVPKQKLKLSADSTRIIADVRGLGMENYQVKVEDTVKIFFSDSKSHSYNRTVPLQEINTDVIKAATAIRSTNGGVDSLFVEYNFDLAPEDIALKEALIKVNGKDVAVKVVRQPGRNLLLIESTGIDWSYAQNFVQLHDLATFVNMPFIVDEEYARQVPITMVERIPQIASWGGGYFDSNLDGTMDSIVIRFSEPLTEAQLAMLNFTIPWYSYRNRLVQLMPTADELFLDPNDPTQVIWKVRSNVEMRSGLTSLNPGLPNADLFVSYEVAGIDFMEHRSFTMQDKMPPAITSVHLRYAEDGDTLVVKLSEPVDYSQIKRTDIFKYVHGADTLVLRPLDISLSSDGKTAYVVLMRGEVDPVIPGDYLLLRGDGEPGGQVVDFFENQPHRDSKPVLVQGGLNHLVQSSNMGYLTYKSMDSLALLGTVSINSVPGSMRSRDLREAGKVGQLIELGQRFMPQLVHQSGVDPEDIDPEDVSITVSTYFFDSHGQYVSDTVMVFSCTHPAFGGNCLNTTKKMFVNWNFKDRTGRFVGTGVYVTNFNLIIRYEGATIKEERTEKVGVRRKKN